jgi:hypothetical protein
MSYMPAVAAASAATNRVGRTQWYAGQYGRERTEGQKLSFHLSFLRGD